jgi:hypothetical protein
VQTSSICPTADQALIVPELSSTNSRSPMKKFSGESQAVASAAQGGGVSSTRKTGGSSFGTTSVA